MSLGSSSGFRSPISAYGVTPAVQRPCGRFRIVRNSGVVHDGQEIAHDHGKERPGNTSTHQFTLPLYFTQSNGDRPSPNYTASWRSSPRPGQSQADGPSALIVAQPSMSADQITRPLARGRDLKLPRAPTAVVSAPTPAGDARLAALPPATSSACWSRPAGPTGGAGPAARACRLGSPPSRPPPSHSSTGLRCAPYASRQGGHRPRSWRNGNRAPSAPRWIARTHDANIAVRRKTASRRPHRGARTIQPDPLVLNHGHRQSAHPNSARSTPRPARPAHIARLREPRSGTRIGQRGVPGRQRALHARDAHRRLQRRDPPGGPRPASGVSFVSRDAVAAETRRPACSA